MEEVAALIASVVWTRHGAEEVSASVAVVIVDAEVPAPVGEDDRAIEIAVARHAVPDGVAKEGAQGYVARIAHCHVVIVVVAHGHIIEVAVHAPDVVVVDAVYLIYEEWVSYAESVCHAVGEKTCVAPYSGDAHALSAGCECACHDDKGCEYSSESLHNRKCLSVCRPLLLLYGTSGDEPPWFLFLRQSYDKEIPLQIHFSYLQGDFP